MAKTETQVNDLKLNFLTKEQFETAKEAGQLSTTELYFTPSELPVYTFNKWTGTAIVDASEVNF